METANFLTEHQFVLKKQQELVNEISKVDDKFANIDVIYNLETADEVLCALASKFEKLNKNAIKREPRQACLNIAEREHFIQSRTNATKKRPFFASKNNLLVVLV